MSIKFKDLEEGDKFKTLADNSAIYKKEKRYVKERWAFNAWKFLADWNAWEDGQFFADSVEVVKV